MPLGPGKRGKTRRKATLPPRSLARQQQQDNGMHLNLVGAEQQQDRAGQSQSHHSLHKKASMIIPFTLLSLHLSRASGLVMDLGVLFKGNTLPSNYFFRCIIFYINRFVICFEKEDKNSQTLQTNATPKIVPNAENYSPSISKYFF